MNFNLPVPKFLQKGAKAIPFVGDILNMVGEYSANRKAGLSDKEAARRAVAVGGAGVAASALFPADVPTYAPSVLRAGASLQRQTPVGKSYELMRGLGVAAPPNPRVLEATASMVDKINPEAWARTIVDRLDPSIGYTTFSLNPDERLEQLKERLLETKLSEALRTGK